VGHFLPTWIWIQIQPTKSNADPIGSVSRTLLEAVKTSQFFAPVTAKIYGIVLKKRHVQERLSLLFFFSCRMRDW
jgi:hypothetical protein